MIQFNFQNMADGCKFYKGNSSHRSWLNHAQTGGCFDKAGCLFVRGKIRRPEATA